MLLGKSGLLVTAGGDEVVVVAGGVGVVVVVDVAGSFALFVFFVVDGERSKVNSIDDSVFADARATSDEVVLAGAARGDIVEDAVRLTAANSWRERSHAAAVNAARAERIAANSSLAPVRIAGRAPTAKRAPRKSGFVGLPALPKSPTRITASVTIATAANPPSICNRRLVRRCLSPFAFWNQREPW